jgi:hypothetical protein
MALSNSHKIPEIQKLLKELKEEIDLESCENHNTQYALGIDHCIEKIREIIDSV